MKPQLRFFKYPARVKISRIWREMHTPFAPLR
jgi:hypothetical protein